MAVLQAGGIQPFSLPGGLVGHQNVIFRVSNRYVSMLLKFLEKDYGNELGTTALCKANW